jgi:hypothetical protein
LKEEDDTMGLTVLKVEVGNPANPEVTEEYAILIESKKEVWQWTS